jgi:hypothetical protein
VSCSFVSCDGEDTTWLRVPISDRAKWISGDSPILVEIVGILFAVLNAGSAAAHGRLLVDGMKAASLWEQLNGRLGAKACLKWRCYC